jgi:hypothetical protein
MDRPLISRLTCSICFLFFYLGSMSQNTVGVLSYQPEVASEGYTLLYPLKQGNVYLIDNCGEVVHEWIDSSVYVPGISAYLLEDGNLLKTKKLNYFIPGTFSSGGAGAIIELVSWDNELIWSKEIIDSTFRAHHDVEILPNGNVLIIVWQRRSREEYLQAGGDTSLFNLSEIWPDIIQEYDPVLDSVVWLWDSWNHLIQDFDSGKSNFGLVSSNPGKIDLNYDLGIFGGRPDWIHSNAIDYNENLDQIVVSASHFEEIWIIDHSTTTEEAKGNTGGQYGKGGQLLFRWGNPRAYKMGDHDDKQLFFQHNVHWIDDPSLENSAYYQQIGLFNNRIESDQSAISILKPTLDNVTMEYVKESGTYLPSFFSKSIESSDDLPFHSTNMSSMQVLPNGNFLVCGAQAGRIIEITPDNEVAWDYKLPYRNGFRINQGSNLNIGDNVIFRAKRYHINYEAFSGKDLEPKYYLELDPDLDFCNLSVHTIESKSSEFTIYPLPTSDILNIQSDETIIKEVSVYNSIGLKTEQFENVNSLNYSINTTKYKDGLYYVTLNNSFIYKVLKISQ